MQRVAANARDAVREAAAADFPLIRQFKVANQFAATPQATAGGVWVACTPENFGGFTAAGVYFARELWRELGVPIGLVNSSYGNTPIAS
jgi:sialate O-acetylesterase